MNKILVEVSVGELLDKITILEIKKGLSIYNGVRRRFEIKFILKNDIMIIDDYAHHPSEVISTLNAAKNGWNRRIIAIFQPHLFTRTREVELHD